MKYLCFFAHPDDEVVAGGGTIRQLADNGDEVVVVLATDGGGSGKKGADAKTRKKELADSCRILGVKEFKILKYKDGEITNSQVWGEMTEEFIVLIEQYKPEAVMTFDHSGWYFHLDHVGVSLAALRAVQKSNHQVDVLLFNLFHPPGTKSRWPYVYQKKLPVTHEVDIRKVKEIKIEAIKAHQSQQLPFMVWLPGGMDKEYFQLVLASKKGKIWLEKSKIFKKV